MATAVNPPINHHAQPVFYLRQWTSADGRLCEFSRRPHVGSIQHKWKFPKGTGYVRSLNTIPGLPGGNEQIVETQFMMALDTRASDVLVELLAGRCADLDAAQRLAWSHFIVSLLLRVKEVVELLKGQSEAYVAEVINEHEQVYANVREPDEPDSLKALTDAREPYMADLSAFEVQMGSIKDPRLNDAILAMKWVVRDLSHSVVPLVTSDRPIDLPNGLDGPAAFIALPVGPKHLFVAAYDLQAAHELLHKRPTQVAKRVNRKVIKQARNYVWSIDKAPLAEVEQFLSKLPDRVLLTKQAEQRVLAAARSGRLVVPAPTQRWP